MQPKLPHIEEYAIMAKHLASNNFGSSMAVDY